MLCGGRGEATSNPFERLSDFNATGSSPKAPQQRSSLRGGPSTGMSPSKSQQDLAAAAIAVLAAAGYDTAAAAMHGLSAEEAAATVTLGGGSARARASASPFQPADGSGSAGKMHRPSKGLLSPAEQLRSSLYGKQTAAAAVADLRPASAPGPQARGKVEGEGHHQMHHLHESSTCRVLAHVPAPALRFRAIALRIRGVYVIGHSTCVCCIQYNGLSPALLCNRAQTLSNGFDEI